MERSKLKWEDVSRFEEVKGYGQQIWRHKGRYYFVATEGGIAEQRVVYDLSSELFRLLRTGERTLLDIHYRVKYDVWPPTDDDKDKISRERVRERPITLISNPKNQMLFTRKELEDLIPIAEQKWIDWRGKLPDDYVSPLK